MPDKDPYRVLNLPRDASSLEVRKAYRRLALLYHPDLNPGSKEMKERFRRIQEAYKALRRRAGGVKYRAEPLEVTGKRSRTAPLLMGLKATRPSAGEGYGSVDLYQAADERLDGLSVADLSALLSSHQNRFLQAAALQALGKRKSPEAVLALLSFASVGPPVLRPLACDCLKRSLERFGSRIMAQVWNQAGILQKYQLLMMLEELKIPVPAEIRQTPASDLPRLIKVRLKRLVQTGRDEKVGE